jgi:hypothetical protein
VNAPDRQVYPLLIQSLSPSEHVLVDAIDQCTIQVEEENGFDARHAVVFELTQGYRSGTKIPALFISAF